MGDGNREFKEYVTLTHFSLLQVRQELEASKARVEGDMAAAEEARESFSVLAVEAMQEVRDKSEQTIKGLESEVERFQADLALAESNASEVKARQQTRISFLEEDVAKLLEAGKSLSRDLAEEKVISLMLI
jgi:hypothetical protein